MILAIGSAIMLLAIGSTNKAKVTALKETIQEYPQLAQAQVVSLNVLSEITHQPLSLAETIQGAKNRSRNCFEKAEGCNFGFGVESGLMEAPGTQTSYLHISVCSIYNGKDYYIGIGMGFEVPRSVLSILLQKKIDLQQACLESGISSNQNLGSQEGLIGILTKGRIDRKEYSKQAIRSALVQLDCAELYLK